MSQQVIWNEEYSRANAPARVGVMGEGLIGPTLIAYGTEAQKSRFLGADPARDRALVPGLLRTERRIGPGQRPDQSRPGRRRVGDHAARRSGPPTPSGPTGAFWWPGPIPDSPGTRASRISWSPMDQPGHRGPAHPPDHGDGRVQRGLLRRGPDEQPIWWSARWTTAGGWPWPPWPSSAGVGLLGEHRPLPPPARPGPRPGPEERAGGRPRPPPAAGRVLGPALHPPAEHPAVPDRRRGAGGPPRGLDLQALLGHLAPGPGRAGHGRPRDRGHGGRRGTV